jgi:hypothetical protein
MGYTKNKYTDEKEEKKRPIKRSTKKMMKRISFWKRD